MASILLISDNAGTRELARASLVIAGHEVCVAHDTVGVRRHFELALVDTERAEVAAPARAVATRVVLFSQASEDVSSALVAKSGAWGYVRKLGPARLLEDVQLLLA